jgi:monofunctional glycosyltransferase
MNAWLSHHAPRIAAWTRDAPHPARVARRFALGLAGLFVAGHALLLVVVAVSSLVLLRANPSSTALMAYRWITSGQKSAPIRFVRYSQIPRDLRNMVTRLEDYRFWEHHGVDAGAIHDAWSINASIGRVAVGGSTIPMQLARNLFLTPRKTYFRKYMEALTALEMDQILSKQRILELYLNCIEWGPGVFGIGNAAAYYYKSAPSNLGLDAQRRLATIITNPRVFSVLTFRKSAQMRERYAYLESRYPDPGAMPTDTGKVAPVPDAPDAAGGGQAAAGDGAPAEGTLATNGAQATSGAAAAVPAGGNAPPASDAPQPAAQPPSAPAAPASAP